MKRVAIARVILAALVVLAGATHFTSAAFFVAIVPAWLPAPLWIVWVSGAAELAGGLGLLWPPTRKAAAFGLMLLFVAVFPANLNQAIHHIPVNGRAVAPALLWARLFVQPLLVYWAWAVRGS